MYNPSHLQIRDPAPANQTKNGKTNHKKPSATKKIWKIMKIKKNLRKRLKKPRIKKTFPS